MPFAQSVRNRLHLGVAGQIEVGCYVGGQHVDARQEFFNGQISPHAEVHRLDESGTNCLLQTLDIYRLDHPRRECLQVGRRDRLGGVGCGRALASRDLGDVFHQPRVDQDGHRRLVLDYL